jgi:spermidine synthase
MMAVLLPIFFLSGAAALLYQMIWQRMLTLFGGADVSSVTIIVSAFMFGLGLGSLAGGHYADRRDSRGCLRAFAAAELAVALFAAASPWLLFDVLYVRFGALGLSRLATAGVLFAVLLWPTFFMGASLPLLARAATRSAALSPERVGSLYGWNTLGAATGSLVSVWVLARFLGFSGTIRFGVGLNLLCAAAALLLERRQSRLLGTPSPAPAPLANAPPVEGGFGFRTWLALYALAGFVALSLEILWFRLLGTILKSNSFTFATLLAVYLVGVGGGALLGRAVASRTSRPAAWFLALQAGVAVYAGLSLTLFVFALDGASTLAPVGRYLAGSDPLDVAAAVRALQRYVRAAGTAAPFARDLAGLFLQLYVLVPAFLIGVPTLLMGASFPFVQRAVHERVETLGRRVGWLQTANILGSTLGAVLTGLVLLNAFGSLGTLRLLVGLASVFVALLARLQWAGASRGGRLVLVAAMGMPLATAAMLPTSATLWARLHGTSSGHVVFAEDGSGLSVLKDERIDGREVTTVYISGIGESQLPYGGYHTVLGALPVALHPAPRSVLVIGLGSGDTLFGTGGRPETERMECVEILAPQLQTLALVDRQRPYAGLRALLRDGRVHHQATDGRALLMHGERRYDVIQADALRPGSAYAGNLYSVEYFDQMRRRLRPGGFGVSWGPTARTRAAFVKAFPHVLVLGHTLIGSESEIMFDPEVVRARLRQPFTRGYYERAGIDITALLGPILDGPIEVFGPEVDRSRLVDVNTDLFPKDEYLASESFIAWGR